MKFLYWVILLLFVTLSGSVSAQTDIEGSFICSGIDRTYRLYIPEIYDASAPVPLVLNLHGYGSNSSEQEVYADFRGIADTANFIIVLPDGTPDNGGNQFWNSFALGQGVDDTAFLSTLIDTVMAHYSIDPNCIYSTGMSNGGFMSYELACQLSGRIAAIASVTGSMTLLQQSGCDAQHPTPVMQIHGTADGTVSYNGSFGVYAIEDLVANWVNFNHCSSSAVITEVPDNSTNDGCTAEHYLYPGGDAGSSVELYKIIGGDHSWPGAPVNINVTNMDFSASKEIWRFFRKYKLSTLTSAGVEIAEQKEFMKIFPNPASEYIDLNFSSASTKEIVVTNAQGKLIHREKYNGISSRIYLEEKGLFFVSVSENGHQETERIILY